MKYLISSLIKKVEKIIGYFKYLFLLTFDVFFKVVENFHYTQNALIVNKNLNTENNIIFSVLVINRRR